jgi:hypothetical protein
MISCWLLVWCVLLLRLFSSGSLSAQTLNRAHIGLVNPLEYGASCTHTTLSAAVSVIGSTRATLMLTATDRDGAACTWALTGSVTVPDNITLRVPHGAALTITGGNTLTLAAQPLVDYPTWYSGAGSVVILQPAFPSVSPAYVHGGCLPTTSGSTTLTAFACIAKVSAPAGNGDLSAQSAASVTLSGGNGTYWLALHWDTSTAVSGWTRESGTRYLWKIATDLPPNPANGLIVARVTVASGAATVVADYRQPRSYALYRRYDITDPLFGGVGDAILGTSGTDNVAAFNIARQAAATRRGTIYFPHGSYRFNSKPGGIYGGVTIECEDIVTFLVRNYSEGTPGVGFLDMDVANTGDLTNGGGGVKSCGIYAESGTTGGAAINMQSSSTSGQGFIYLSKLYITGAGTFAYGARADGSLKTSAPAGVRDISITECNFFQSTVAGIILLGFNNALIASTAVYVASGDGLIADGGTGGGVPSNYLNATLNFCPTAKFGATQATTQIVATIPNVTTVTTASTMSNLTVIGNVGTWVGTATASASGIGVSTPGKIVSGIGVPTTGGARFETYNGYTFPSTQVPVGQRNTLDDYERDTFVPLVYGSTTSGVTTYDAQFGYYTKVGNIVCIGGTVAWSNMTGTGNLRLNLPFAPINDGNYLGPLTVVANNLVIGAGKQLAALTSPTGAVEVIFYLIDVDGGGGLAQVPVDTAASLYFGGCYFAVN